MGWLADNVFPIAMQPGVRVGRLPWDGAAASALVTTGADWREGWRNPDFHRILIVNNGGPSIMPVLTRYVPATWKLEEHRVSHGKDIGTWQLPDSKQVEVISIQWPSDVERRGLCADCIYLRSRDPVANAFWTKAFPETVVPSWKDKGKEAQLLHLYEVTINSHLKEKYGAIMDTP